MPGSVYPYSTFSFLIHLILGSIRGSMKDQIQSATSSHTSKSGTSSDDDDSTLSSSKDGLSKYERKREKKIARNKQRLSDLGLGPKGTAAGKRGGGQSRDSAKPRRSAPTCQTRQLPVRDNRGKKAGVAVSFLFFAF